MTLTLNNISKKIKDKTILDNISLKLVSGTIYGFVGVNGSGKTMLFRAISGLMKTTSGEIDLDGKVLHRDIKVLPNMGIIIENAGLYPDLSGFENLKILAKINKKITDNDIRETIKKVGLDPGDKRAYKKYSLGMKQRIILAQAIMENPDILLLDEPTNALDEDGINEIRKIILEMKDRGALILIASHNKDDIEQLADKVYLVKKGSVTERIDTNEA